VEERIVVAAAEGEMADCVGIDQPVPRLVELMHRDTDLRIGSLDVLVGDTALDRGGFCCCHYFLL